MKIDPVTFEVDASGGTRPVYVWEAPVRVWHTWITYDFGYVRMVHFAAGLFFTALFIYRLFWVAVGNRYARMIFFPPLLSMKWWKGVFAQVAYYLFMRKSAPEYAGHNPLAQLAMFAMFVLGSFVIIITGLVRLGVRALRRRPGGPHGAPRDDVRVHPLQHRPHLHELPRRRHGRRHHALLDEHRPAHVQGGPSRLSLIVSGD